MTGREVWRVAVIGAGPAAMYAVEQLLEQDAIEIEIDIFERLPTPWGLVRNGVAPDHPEKKLVVDRQFVFFLKDPRVRFFGAVEIGRDIQHSDLIAWYDSVIYAVGADGNTPLSVPGEDLPGCWSARSFVSWCNGHPNYSDLKFDFSCERAIIVGNGNVALDVARLLVLSAKELARTDIADHALVALEKSVVREVVVLGRRGLEHAAFHNPELEELPTLNGVDVLLEGDDFDRVRRESPEIEEFELRRKLATLERISRTKRAAGNKRLILQFLSAPIRIEGQTKVQRVMVSRNRLERQANGAVVARASGQVDALDCGLVFCAAGYRGTPILGLPFDTSRGVIRNDRGRVGEENDTPPGVYVTGWAKRGCKGVIGSNKKCASETVGSFLADVRSGGLQRHSLSKDAIADLLVRRSPNIVSRLGWEKIDRFERDAGRRTGRPRVKVTDRNQMMEIAKS